MKAALTTCTSVTTLHLTNGGASATPAGEFLTPETTVLRGFTPTHVIEPTGFIWYSDPYSGSFPAGTFVLNLWTNHPGGRSPVFAQLGVSAADGGGFSPLAVSSTRDVNTTGGGNHATTLAIPIGAAIALAGQRLVVKVFLDAAAGNTPPTMVYNAGLDFDTFLQTTAACVTPTLNGSATLHLTGTTEPDVAPAGQHLRRTSSGATGFTPTAGLSATPRYWYTETSNLDLPSSSATFTLWTNAPGARSIVNVRIERTAADGSGAVLLAEASADVNGSGGGNHATTFGPFALPTVAARGQRLRVSLTRTSGAAVTAVFNAGIDFDTRLTFTVPTQSHTTNVPVLKDAEVVLTSVGGVGPNDNLGSSPEVVVGQIEITSRGLFGYSLLGIPSAATVRKAELVIPPVRGLPSGAFTGRLARVNDSASWSESTVTWNNQPASTDLGITFSLHEPEATSARVDVTSVVAAALRAGTGQVSFVISSVTSNVFIWSKENTEGGSPTSLSVQWDASQSGAPIAAAGADQTALVGRQVTLDGSASRDPDGGPLPLSYLWTQTSGPAVALGGATAALASFMPASPGTYAFQLQVSDGAGTSIDDVTITVVADPAVPGSLVPQRIVYAAPNLDYGYLAQPPLFYNSDCCGLVQAQGDYREYDHFSNPTYSTRTVDMSVFDCAGGTGFPPISPDASNVPLNGIFYLPPGTGPFPIAVFVHGNHEAVERSEPGYEEAAAHLASQGILAATIDENYANVGCGYAGRAVLLLENVKQFRIWNTTAGHPLFGKIDLSRVMIIGHSRGGEAVQIASFFNEETNDGVTSIRPYPNLPEFSDVNAPVSVDGSDHKLGPWQFGLRAVVAIAPSEGNYLPVDPADDTKVVQTVVRDSFFLIHGTRDADIGQIVGYQGYDRAVPFDPHSAADTVANDKGLLYVFNANHNYFNRVWALHPDGNHPMCAGTCYEPDLTLSKDDQYQTLKTWLATIAAPTLLNRPESLDLLREKVLLAAALPSAIHMDSGRVATLGFNSQLQDRFRLLIDHYEEDTALTTTSPLPPGITGQNEILGLDVTEEPFTSAEAPFFLEQTNGMNARWASSGTRTYRVALSSGPRLVTSSGQPLTDVALRIGFTVSEAENPVNVNQDFTLELGDADAVTYALPASTLFVAVPVLPYDTSTIEGAFLGGPATMVMQTVRFPLELFAERGVNVQNLTSISLRFDRTASGSAYVDDIQLTH